ncbi:hypothetical protein [Mesorhizobium sp.]|uniref:hypothetical protein n=1 Tax=Mesorhizobium sp. TaxID=1871066 RepID=UPI000FE4BC11|nr:hypothetical protein [Mesorhizobium sp.]RWP72377.1 MAG: hypothetical protein EOR09_21270 [Mesorhizobium sp.]
MTREVPSLADVSPTYGRIAARLDELNEREHTLSAEKAKLTKAFADWGPTAEGDKRSRVDDIVQGKPFERRSPATEEISGRIADIEEETRLIREAKHLLQNERAQEYLRASRLVCAAFADEHRALAEKFYGILVEAAEIRIEIGLLHLDIARSGASADYLYDAGNELLDGCLDRTGGLAQELRNGIRRGYLKADALPEELR